MMQQLGPYLLAKDAETADLRKRLAASKERAKINQMVCDHEERGVSTFHHNHWRMYSMFLFFCTSLIVQLVSSSESRLGCCFA